MSEFVKYIGVIIILIGVAILVTPFLMGTTSNALLLTGLAVIILGFISFIAIWKRSN